MSERPPARGSRPRTDWAHLAPMPLTQRTPPVTFHGERFGRSVAGARTMAASLQHRQPSPGRAPSGVLLDAARVETIVPPPERESKAPEPTLPEGAPVPRPEPVHRRAAPAAAPDDGPAPMASLTTSDLEVAFEAAPSRPGPDEPLLAISWTAESGFRKTGTAPVPPIAEPPDTDGGPVDDGAATGEEEPALRYVPAPGPREERPSRDLVDLVESVTGVDVGDTVIDRSPEVSDRAAAMGAVAFTDRSTVHVPSELGDLAEPRTRAVVAHELTHVAQQRLRRATVPDESSPEGRALETEARVVQQLAGGDGVRPHFLRDRDHAPQLEPEVQRLPDDDDAYSWQNRDSDPSPSREREMLGLFGGYSWREGSRQEQAREREDEAWARRFEYTHRSDLVRERNEHYEDLLEEALRDKRVEALRTEYDDAELTLTRTEMIGIREQVDREMPFQFGVPEGERAFPEYPPLPDATPEEEAQAAARAASSASTAATAAAATAAGTGTPGTGPRRRLPTSPGRPAARGRGGRGRPGARDDDDSFDWQERPLTDQQTNQALFGGGLLGQIIGESLGEETDEDRARAERARGPDLQGERQRLELRLRRRHLADKLRDRGAAAARTETEAATEPITLTKEDMIAIREEVDREKPLEFILPQYLPPHVAAQIAPGGEVVDLEAGTELPSAAEETAETEAAETARAQAEGDQATEPAAPGETETEEPAVEIAPDLALAGEEADEDEDEDVAGEAVAARESGSALTSALAAAGGAAAGAAIANRLDDADEDDEDESVAQGEAATNILAAASDLDIDALSRKVWRRIRREMRTELLIDRERAGSLADIR